ncbi:hypothetical protein [Nocardia sp. NPDC052566]|uniref:hypothetical protein n=1 Tax=Nocardia sp. NPDC052566 TaxID=3364330 RepID=UPI0037C99D3E
MVDRQSHGSSEISALAQRVAVARGKLPLQHDAALFEVMSEAEIEAERELAEWVRAQRRGQRRRAVRDELTTEQRDRKSAAAIRRADDADARWHRRALAARRRVANQDARLAQLYRRAEWSSRALIAVVVLGMVWAGVNVQHNLVPSGDMSDPLYWLSYGIEAMISIPIITIMVVTTTAARWGREVSRGKVIFFETALLGTTIALNAGPHLAAGEPGRAAEYAIAPVMVGVVIWLHAWVSARYALLIDSVPIVDDAPGVLTGELVDTPLPTHLPEPADRRELLAANRIDPASAFFAPETTQPRRPGDGTIPVARFEQMETVVHHAQRVTRSTNAPITSPITTVDSPRPQRDSETPPDAPDTASALTQPHRGTAAPSPIASDWHTPTATTNTRAARPHTMPEAQPKAEYPTDSGHTTRTTSGPSSLNPHAGPRINTHATSRIDARPTDDTVGQLELQVDTDTNGAEHLTTGPVRTTTGTTEAPTAESDSTTRESAHPANPRPRSGPAPQATTEPSGTAIDTPTHLSSTARTETDETLRATAEFTHTVRGGSTHAPAGTLPEADKTLRATAKPTHVTNDESTRPAAANPETDETLRATAEPIHTAHDEPTRPAAAQTGDDETRRATAESAPPQRGTQETLRAMAEFTRAAIDESTRTASAAAPVRTDRTLRALAESTRTASDDPAPVAATERPLHAAGESVRRAVRETTESQAETGAADAIRADTDDTHRATRTLRPAPEPIDDVPVNFSPEDLLSDDVEDNEVWAVARVIAGRRQSPMPVEQVAEILTLADQSWSPAGIAGEVGLARATVVQILDAARKVYRPYAVG